MSQPAIAWAVRVELRFEIKGKLRNFSRIALDIQAEVNAVVFDVSGANVKTGMGRLPPTAST
jgi:hypothetical protein